MMAGPRRFGSGFGAGKVILLGEHAVVYGRPALAAGLPDGVEVRVSPTLAGKGRIHCEEWGLDLSLDASGTLPLALQRVLEEVGATGTGWELQVSARLPAAAGLGSSAALCVAVARAAASWLGLPLSDEAAAAAALEGERCFHGTPSGIDNTVAAFGGVLRFQRPDSRQQIDLPVSLPLVVAHSGENGQTAVQVAGLRQRWSREPARFDAIFDAIAELIDPAIAAIVAAKPERLGPLLTANHHLLRQLGVSTERLDEIVSIALDFGALGAKLTGAGGGGCALALCPEAPEKLVQDLERQGFTAFMHTLLPRAGTQRPED